MSTYLRDGAEIYRRSFATIRAEADLDGLDPVLARAAVRMIHACGMVDLTRDIAASPGFAAAAVAALGAGAPVLCDTEMVAAGVTRARLPAGNAVVCTLGDPAVPALAAALGTTRSAAALELWRDRLDGALAVVGNAPTALFRLLELVDAGAGRPAAVIGVPVGFVGAAESKVALARCELESLVVHGRRGGSAIAAAAVNALAVESAGADSIASSLREHRGRLYGVGVGPGDPELLTLKARRVIEATDVVAYPTARHGRSVARRIAAPFLRADQIEIALTYPVTTEATDRYEAALTEFYDASARELAAHLDAGRDVAVLCEGDPFFYGSYMYLHERLAGRYATEVVPGVTSFSGAAAAAGRPLVRRDEVFTVVPGTLPSLDAHLAQTDAAVVLKLGRTFDRVRAAVERAGITDRAVYVERATAPEQRVAALADVDGEVPYMSLLLIPSGVRPERNGRGEVAVVGLGPAGPEWLTPEARAVVAAADDVVGYGPYVARVPSRAGQRRHASDNRVEAERARHALELAAAGRRVAVVSSGDPGIFAMATAVLEALDARAADVDVRVVPGLSAMQAAAARAGAPLGHDFCVLSLSDRLKPWEVIERRLEAACAADLVLALYNPASRSRRAQLERACAVIARHRAPDTPVVVARDVGGAGEEIAIATLATLDSAAVDMRTVLLVGSSTTRAISGRPLVYTPRRYPA